MGRIIKIQREHQELFVDIDHFGKYGDYSLCTKCSKFVPDSKNNCTIIRELNNINKDLSILTSVWECSQFEEKKGVNQAP